MNEESSQTSWCCLLIKPDILQARSKLVEMYQKGEIDATTAMQMMADLSAPGGQQSCDKGKVDADSRKRKHAPPDVPSESDEDDDTEALQSELDSAVMDSLLDQDVKSKSTYQPSCFYLLF